MCRIYGHIATNPIEPSDYLISSSCSLLAQSEAKKNFKQKDGWGISALKNGTFSITKSAHAIYKETDLLTHAAKKSSSRIVIAHIRAASNPLKLPMKKLIAKKHSQPFGTKNFSFAHNGSLNIAAAARERLLGHYRKYLKGNNDSEIYFWILMKWHAQTHNVEIALIKTVKEIWQLWNSLSKKERKGFKAPYTGLNSVISDGQKLFALCHSLRPPTTKSLCLKDQPYNRLAFRMGPANQRFVIGSEKFSGESDWEVVPMHSLTIAEQKNGTISKIIKKFPWKQ